MSAGGKYYSVFIRGDKNYACTPMLFWPGRAIPEWFQKITFSGESTGIPTAKFNGFGIIYKKNGYFQALILAGGLIKIDGAGMSCCIVGQGGGVYIRRVFKRQSGMTVNINNKE